jgi:hypothetical protein
MGRLLADGAVNDAEGSVVEEGLWRSQTIEAREATPTNDVQTITNSRMIQCEC